MAFVTELWNSIFTPGVPPVLLAATHVSFIVLISSLILLVYVSRSVHFVNLLVIALVLYGLVMWFVGELEREKQKENSGTTTKDFESTEETQEPQGYSTAPTVNENSDSFSRKSIQQNKDDQKRD